MTHRVRSRAADQRQPRSSVANRGFYEKSVKDRYAVYSLDHGVVWITYRPNLPARQVDEPRSYGD
jgi:hypothetical protein